MKILIDADACPVTKIAVNIAKSFGIECILFCDTAHTIEIDGAVTIIVDGGADSADFALVNKVNKGDICITQDYGLASMCLAKRAYAINQNGLEYTSENIVYLMETRHTAKMLRMSGVYPKGKKPRRKEDDRKFERAFRTLVEQCTNQTK